MNEGRCVPVFLCLSEETCESFQSHLQVLIPFVEDGSVVVEQNVNLPDYLPEDESPSQEPDKAVSRVGSGQEGAGWLGAATNFLSRSFYW